MKQEIERVLRKTPSIKAKDIAKRLGVDKKSINPILYANDKLFVRDEDYRWSLVNSSSLRIELAMHEWVDCFSFEQTLLTSGSPLDTDLDSILFIVPEKCSILLDAASRFLALCNQLVDIGKVVTVDFSDCKSTLTFFDRIGFFKHLNSRVDILPGRPVVSRADVFKGNSDAVVEFGPVDPTQSNKLLINQLVDRFVSQSCDVYEGAASTVFGELINNIKDHSESKIKGFAALHKYGGRRPHIQTVVSDSGLGIAATLKPSIETHHPGLFRYSKDDDYDIQIVKEVMTKGEISRYGAGRGLGFKSSREQAMKFNARLSIRQENFALELVYNNGQLEKIDTHTNLVAIHGTHLCFDFFID